MADAKLEFKLGSIEFSGEGEKDWVAAQLDKILEQVPKLMKAVPEIEPRSNTNNAPSSHTPMGTDSTIAQQPLATFLREKSASANQVKKFLATAVWLEAKGKSRVTSADVTKALKDSNQTRLANPSDCLNKNVSKGFCEKDGKEFFVTIDGKNSL